MCTLKGGGEGGLKEVEGWKGGQIREARANSWEGGRGLNRGLTIFYQLASLNEPPRTQKCWLVTSFQNQSIEFQHSIQISDIVWFELITNMCTNFSSLVSQRVDAVPTCKSRGSRWHSWRCQIQLFSWSSLGNFQSVVWGECFFFTYIYSKVGGGSLWGQTHNEDSRGTYSGF